MKNTAKTAAKAAIGPVQYDPRQDSDYMGEKMLAYFETKLRAAKSELLSGARKSDAVEIGLHADQLDLSSIMSDNDAIAAARRVQAENFRVELAKIDAALDRIESGEYGYCQNTGNEIGVDNLMRLPTAFRIMKPAPTTRAVLAAAAA